MAGNLLARPLHSRYILNAFLINHYDNLFGRGVIAARRSINIKARMQDERARW